MSIRKHQKLMFKLKYTSSLVNQRDKEIVELNQRINRGNDFIKKIQELMFRLNTSVFVNSRNDVRLIQLLERGQITEESKIKF